MSSADLHTLTGAYAVHALSEEERAAFERHLAACRPCAEEISELSATAARLGQAVSDTPPPEMRQRVLDQIATVRQEPPKVSARGRGGRAGGARTARALPRMVLAACLAGVAAFGGIAVWQYQQAEDARQRAEQAQQRSTDISALLTAPDASVETSELPGGATGTVVVSRERNQAAFLASDMPTPPRGKVYQLWFNDGGTMRSAGLMDAQSARPATVMAGDLDRASGMGITVEPAGGSDRPTSEPLAEMEFPG
ncbi:anti-sigma factor [Streptomyces sp. P38-E01]|uniref:Regulator of SigK n=1 Tax=Streptomyces tardus TaxID=2780544 RepID=A0A949N7Y7_9ACTN|nr:anti-sigma factor [Streptomyces tardus]MBU7600607.1 anti-sigma factor [Streptomyces tardus]